MGGTHLQVAPSHVWLARIGRARSCSFRPGWQGYLLKSNRPEHKIRWGAVRRSVTNRSSPSDKMVACRPVFCPLVRGLTVGGDDGYDTSGAARGARISLCRVSP